MANVVAMGPNPNIAIAQNFTDQFMRNELARQQQALQAQQLAQQGDYQQGMLQNASGQLDLLKQKFNDETLKAQAEPIVQRLQSYYDALQSTDDPNRKVALQAEIQQFVGSLDPKLKPYIAIAAAEPVMTPARQAALNTGKFAQTQTGIAAGGGTDPNAVNYTTKMGTGAFMPAEGFRQQQAADLASRTSGATPGGAPSPTAKIPAPSASPVANYEARSTAAMPTASENQSAQTQLTQTAMQEAGAMARQKEKEASDVSSAIGAGNDLRVTSSGAQYADVSQYTGKVKNELVQQYKAKGVPVAASAADVTALHDIDTARLGQQQMYDGILGKLPKDAGGRILGGPENKLSQFFQTDADIAAFNSWRALAIRSLRAMSGSTGLRINKSEIELAVANDIPQTTDTVAVALQKAKNVNAMLMNSEQAQLGTFTPIGAGAPGEVSRPGVSPSALPPGTVSLDHALAHIRQRGSVQ